MDKSEKLADTVQWALQNPQSIFVFNELQKALDEFQSPTPPASDQKPGVEGELYGELINAYDDYIKLLGSSPADSVAYVHGFRYSPEMIQQGKQMREKITELKSKL